MLTRIEIKDFALIDHAILNPGRGLLILSGETGAGKSILIDAIGALGGGRIDRDVIRHGAKRASAEAIFSMSGHDFSDELLTTMGLADDLDPNGNLELILSREILASGKSICRINGRIVSQTVLREISASLIDIHGQHDQQAIFQTDTHLQLLDRFGGEPVNSALQAYSTVFHEYQQCLQQISGLGQDPAERARLLDTLSYQTAEIESARIKNDEDELLAKRRKVVANAEKIRSALSEAYDLLDGDSPQSILGSLGQVASRVDLSVRHLPDLAESKGQIDETIFTLQSIAGELRTAIETTSVDPGELEQLDERLDQLFRLKKKYGGSLDAVAQFYRQARLKLDQINDGEARYDELQQQKQHLQQQLLNQGQRLTQIRKTAAASLEQHITRELGDLGMKGIRFAVRMMLLDLDGKQYSRTGLDKVEFLISPNPGEPLRPLVRIASGGEAARIMLAIKSILARADQIPVLIFDEIDAGVSGRTAGKVAEKLQRLSRGRQVFCITHLAQIAAMADTHLLIEKESSKDQTRTRLTELDDAGRETELARLLSGGIGDAAARQLAGQLLDQAQKIRLTADYSDKFLEADS